jgi:dTDP-4-dehydrorhamnose 3,5-epimerase
VRVVETELPGVLVIEPDVHSDPRGFFVETYHSEKYGAHGITGPFVQDNHSRSAGGTLRGLHLQLRRPQGKLVRVIEGEVYDVAVDVRRGSPTFAHWVAVTLSADNFRQCYIPPGFAHGFLVTAERADVLYKVTDYWSPAHERTVDWNDPALGIRWPLRGVPQLSEKDRAGARLDACQPVLGDSCT